MTTVTPRRGTDAHRIRALRAGLIFDGEQALGPGTVLIKDGRIVAIDTTGASAPGDALVDDLGPEVCLLPGLIDSHVHLIFDASADVLTSLATVDDDALLGRMRVAGRRMLAAGITSVRDLGDRGYLTLRLREEFMASPVDGPDIACAGPPITTRAGHLAVLGGVAEGGEALRAAVRQRAERGCDVVKVIASGGNLTPGSAPHASQYGLTDLRLIVSEAQRLGLATAAHVHGPQSIADAAAAGFDSLEHVTFLTADGVEPDPATVARIVRDRITVSVTVGTVPGAPRGPGVVADRLAALHANAAGLYRVGARIVPGTDAGVSPGKPHDVLPHALSALVGLGMSNREALRSATAVAAEVCGFTGRKGRLVPGYDADLLAVRGDPMTDISAIQNVIGVVRGGIDVLSGSMNTNWVVQPFELSRRGLNASDPDATCVRSLGVAGARGVRIGF